MHDGTRARHLYTVFQLSKHATYHHDDYHAYFAKTIMFVFIKKKIIEREKKILCYERICYNFCMIYAVEKEMMSAFILNAIERIE